MDITRQIHDAENSLREFLNQILSSEIGEEWYKKSPKIRAMAKRWEERRMPDNQGHNRIKGAEKLIQYASIADLRTIIKKYWGPDLKDVFDSPETLDVYLKIIDDFRNPDSRRRELFVHQKHLLLGISGDIRTRIITWRSRKEAGGIYARIECVRDNLGNNWNPGDPRKVKTANILNPNDQLEFIITASDPEESEMHFKCHHTKWQASNIVMVSVDRTMVEQHSLFHIMIKSSRKNHAYPMGFDDRVTFEYEVVPN